MFYVNTGNKNPKWMDLFSKEESPNFEESWAQDITEPYWSCSN